MAKASGQKLSRIAQAGPVNFIAIDASQIAMWEGKHKMWDTWRENVKMIVKIAKDNNGHGDYLSAKNNSGIQSAFEEVAEAMADPGGVDS